MMLPRPSPIITAMEISRLLKPGIMKHDSETGTSFLRYAPGLPGWSASILSVISRIADKYCTVTPLYQPLQYRDDDPKKENVDGIVGDLKKLGLPVGVVGDCISNTVHTHGWIHCQAPQRTLRPVKSIMDELYDYFTEFKLHAK
jgi:sulfite reductase beta subunit